MALAAALAVAAPAGATSYCVNEPVCVAGGGVDEGTSANSVQIALEAAAGHKNSGGPDRVSIGAGSYLRAEGFSYVGEAVVIRGAGAGATTLSRGGPEATTVLGLNAPAASEPTLSGLRIVVPAIKDITGLGLQAGDVEGVTIESPLSSLAATGLDIEGGVFSQGRIEALNGSGVEARGGEVLYSTIDGGLFGVQASGKATFRGDTISGGAPLIAYDPEPLVLEDSLIDMGGSSTVGVQIVANGSGSAKATLRQDAIVHGGQTGLSLDGEKANATATMDDSVIAEVETPVAVFVEGAGKSATLGTDYSSYEFAKRKVGLGAALNAENLLSTVPSFVSPLSGDYHLAPGSPLIDAGTPGATLGAGEFATDIAGNPRIVNGHRDAGPYEYQRRGPSVTGTADRSTVEIGKPVSFSGAATAVEDGDSVVSYQWTFDDGASVPAGASAVHAFALPGSHTATLTATDLAGVKSSAMVGVTATRLAICHEAACGGCGAMGPACLRGVHDLRIKPGSFHAARRGGAIALRRGGQVSYTVTGAVSMVNFTIRKVLRGVANGTGCKKPARGVTGPPCARYGATVGAFSRISPAGGNGFRLTGRARGKKLAPGRYALIAHLASAPHETGAVARFQIVR